MRHRNYAIATFLLLALTGFALLSIYLVRAPEALPASAPATDFSALRAMGHVQQIAKQPHAMGTAAHAEVRNYLFSQMQQLGLQPEVQEAIVVNDGVSATQAGYVYNIVGRLKGQGKGKAVLLMAHYDSQPNTLGAADDGAGIAAMLETARALKIGKPLQNDVIFLMTDGEEYGLYGAKAFLKHPWAKEVGIIVNVEARGNSGPSMTFEISPENGWVIEQFSAAVPYPIANSLAYEVYRKMPNDTDFTVFRKADYAGVNSAFVDGFVHYHKLTDSPENLDRNSLQHHGSNMLALARHFGNIPLENTKSADKVFFNPIGTWLVHYPAWQTIVWVVLASVLLLIVLIVGLKRKAFTMLQVAGSFMLYLLMMAIVAGLFIPLNAFVTGLLPYTHSQNGVYGSNSFFMAYLLLALGLFMLLTWLALRWVCLFSLLLGVYLVWFAVLLVVLFIVPSVSYLFLFPLLFCLAGTLVVLLKDLHQREEICWQYVIVMLLALLPAICIVFPIVKLLFVIFALQLPVAMVAVLLLLLGLAVPLLVVLERSFSWRFLPLLPLLLLLAGAVHITQAVAGEEPTAERPLHSHVSYYLNADTNKAIWASAFTKTDDWNQQFFPNPTTAPLFEIYPIAAREYLKNEAETIKLQAPVAELAQEVPIGADRFLQLKLSSPAGAAHMEIILQPQNPDETIEANLNGEALPLQPIKTDTATFYFLRVHGLPISKEVMLDIKMRKDSKLNVLLYDQTIGLPNQLVRKPRPAHVVPEQGRDSNLTIVRKSYSF
ncbi:M20/M25/M40 family metallo-hydrolase [Pontibacter sp. BT310]|uniref:Vacuolar membrane protease n=1 Tax=Pontibacter populi TaxID=890055 RepID=A0ABS6XFI4_9BACT|nr:MULTISPECIES: M20/M25/M40 family metallo-hydrolase [Pontibacter]MBJ6119898.1 M20/M25/M40 family metallo-hydrolase [Pontibacter sp. BT310]MBR0572327.1 M20/M25/M40 family metallo-hydrolase [Microvirga sp. STS03]MBW3366751.1 M20/M25/M40 family metallo-hydrolase [Pontibacter populi]